MAKTLETVTGDISEVSQFSRWPRPPAIPPNPQKDPLVFMQLDIDYTLGDVRQGMPGATEGTVPIIRMFGVSATGNSILAHVHGFTPYFYVPAPPGFNASHCAQFRQVLNDQLRGKTNEKNIVMKDYVLAVEIIDRQSVFGFYGNATSMFLQIFLALPKHTPTARGILEHGIHLPAPLGYREFQTFESNIPFALRFMVDKDIQGASWVTIPEHQYSVRPKSEHVSHCQIEIDVAYNVIVSHAPEGPWSKLPPFRILSFDIECAGRKGFFPEADKDPVIQIANVVKVQGESKPFISNVFVWGTCKPIVGAHVISFKTEADMLRGWLAFWSRIDPDVIIGYNTANFDIPYLLDRAAALKIDKFPYWGKTISGKTTTKNTTFSSAAYGTRESKSTAIDGRVQLDMLQVIQRDYKLTSYSLNSVSAHFLNEQKEDVHHSIISDLHNGSDEDRHRLAVYCLKDALLPLRLLDKLMIVFNYMEMARVTGVPISFLLERGQQIKVMSQLFRTANPQGLLIPTFRSNPSEEKYEGATVIEPKRGFYDKPIATLDFASLYPSIMRAHNLCYSTLLNPADVHKLKPDDYNRTPLGHYFVKPSLKKGLLPMILENLLNARKRAKEDLKKATDPMEKAVLDGRQLALKISANSVYGFTGATVGQLPCLEISGSVTAYGREMIDKTAALVQEKYTIANGYAHDAVVVYGDTDSVMVKFGVETVAEAMALGREAAECVTKAFINPIKLEFEKVYFPYLLINKKRYAGMYWTKTDKPDKMDAKGIETVRRDNCQLVRTVIGTSLNKILMDRDVEGAIAYVKSVISDLLMNRLDLSMLVITKALSKSGDEYDNKQAHAELAERMRKRDPLTAPAIGDRVPYVITKAAKGAKAYEKAEDPIWVLENNIPIDTTYYLEQQLSQPLLRIFEPIMPNVSSLLSGDHTRNIAIVTPSSNSGGIMRFAVKTTTCLGCKVPIPNSATNQTLCVNCQGREPELYQTALQKVNFLEDSYSRAWTQCQRCQGSFHQEVLCTSRDCPIFYRRRKIQKELKEAHESLDRYKADLDW